MMETRVMDAGTFDIDDQPRIKVVRVKAIVLALLKYGPTLKQERDLCQCPSCMAQRAERR